MRLPQGKNRLNPAAIAAMATRIPILATPDHQKPKREDKQP
jgi:hypothetical protein